MAFTAAARQRLSLCMIVRDEEKRLGRCLASAMPWVGEAVVVDTGSRDRTVALAEAAGARVLRFDWCDDFSKARNFALDAATRKWALVLDADERLVVDDPEGFGRALERAQPVAFSIDCRDQLDEGGVAVGPVMRLFRRDLDGMRYQGEVHEQVMAVARRHADADHARFLHIVHDGYTRGVMAEHRTQERNLALARAMTSSRPEDPFAWFCLGQALSSVDGAEAIAAYERALQKLAPLGRAHRDESYLAALWLGLLRVVMASGDAVKARRLSEGALVDFPRSPDLRFLRGKLLLDAGETAGAAMEFESCLTNEAKSFFLRQDPGAVGYAAETQLGLCYIKLGRLSEAEATLRRARETAPTEYLLPSLMLGLLLLAAGGAGRRRKCWCRSAPTRAR
jgi:tetratricopeptide (TPR) repeat protein